MFILQQKAIIAMHSLSAIAALAEMIIAIVASAYCCAGCSCTTTTPSQTTVVSYIILFKIKTAFKNVCDVDVNFWLYSYLVPYFISVTHNYTVISSCMHKRYL